VIWGKKVVAKDEWEQRDLEQIRRELSKER